MTPLYDDAFESCMKAWTLVTELRLDGFLLAPRNCLHLSHLQALRSLQLQCCPHLQPASLAFLSQLPQLRYLRIEECGQVKLDELLLSTLAHCPRLRQLDCDMECDMEPAAYFWLPHLSSQDWDRLKRVRFETLDGSLQLCRSSENEDKYELCAREETVASSAADGPHPASASSSAAAGLDHATNAVAAVGSTPAANQGQHR